MLEDIQDLIDAGMPLVSIAQQARISAAQLRAALNEGDAKDIFTALFTWKAENDADARVDSGFVMTPTAHEITRAFNRARQLTPDDGRGIALIFGASGTGKTQTAKHYADEHNDRGSYHRRAVVIVRLDDVVQKGFDGVLNAVIREAGDVVEFYSEMVKKPSLTQKIADRLEEGGLVIFDEMQHLSPRIMDSLRILPDKFGIAVAFMGNVTDSARIAKQTQIISRAGGAIVTIEIPKEGDVDALLDKWGVMVDKETRRILLAVGRRDGGLRYLFKVVQAVKNLERATNSKAGAREYLHAAAVFGEYKGGNSNE
ncbi:MAG: AAA family ATPase [Zoogloeaceae bacterium]|nr:AAA family ATPase [Zoogloeaceae bacterium]